MLPVDSFKKSIKKNLSNEKAVMHFEAQKEIKYAQAQEMFEISEVSS